MRRQAAMLPQEGLRELQSGECLELLEGPEEISHACFHGWEEPAGNADGVLICFDVLGISKIPCIRGFPVVQTLRTIETQPKWNVIFT